MALIIALVGAPCSGKSSTLAFLKIYLEKRGLSVLAAEESATRLINAGVDPNRDSFDFQSRVFDLQKKTEDELMEKSGGSSVILTDRALPDAAAYLGREAWLRLLEEKGMEESEILCGRYFSFLHLRSVVTVDPSLYTTKNGITVRTESPGDVAVMEKRIEKIYSPLQNYFEVAAAERFEKKLENTAAAMDKILGMIKGKK